MIQDLEIKLEGLVIVNAAEEGFWLLVWRGKLILNVCIVIYTVNFFNLQISPKFAETQHVQITY